MYPQNNQQPTEDQLNDIIADLKEQLEHCSDDTIADELIKEIKYREKQLQELTIKNNSL